MDKTTSLAFLKPIGRVLSRFHMTIFVVFIIACLAAVVLFLTDILDGASIGDYQSPITSGSIDQATLDRINALHNSDGALPGPITSEIRSNPFNE